MSRSLEVHVEHDDRHYKVTTDGEERGRVKIYCDDKLVDEGRWTGRMIDGACGNIGEDVYDKLDDALAKALKGER